MAKQTRPHTSQSFRPGRLVPDGTRHRINLSIYHFDFFEFFIAREDTEQISVHRLSKMIPNDYIYILSEMTDRVTLRTLWVEGAACGSVS